ncbi:TIGR03790 family protein [Candidatus Nitronereus thalassa]|uniref:TIGR03790 family protein n=1 Tax=Candidatus Nitronereus thalassa TaxID=3020898 RepID=A0ABU3K6X4_9BACT|nr:TIGR03790 family protein [Candidatus Nitronereus thalassa]MDT7042177.1 TIGR03790 family protein [Candidatus Nitronereus thalassa]
MFVIINSIPLDPLAFGAIQPDQVVIVANENDLDGMDVARYYAKQRGIPLSNLVRLNLPYEETISREDFEEYLTKPLKVALESRGLASTTRVLVTTFGVPLRVNAPLPNDEVHEWQADATEWYDAAIEFAHTIDTALSRTLLNFQKGAPPSPSLSSAFSASNPVKAEQILRHIDHAIATITSEIQTPSSPKKPMDQHLDFFKYLLQLDGLSAYTKYPNFKMPTHSQLTPDQLKTHIQLARLALSILVHTPSTQNRKVSYQLAQRFFGIRGVFQLAASEQQNLVTKDTEASVDSELSILWFGQDQYSLNGRIPNPFYAWYPSNTKSTKKDKDFQFPVLMVSRIDAPTPKLSKLMIDRAIMAEQTGVSGKAYFDARGMKSDGPLSYGDYDQSLRNLSAFMRNQTSYRVILENTQKRFQEKGEAPQVGLYAGWYQYREYEDAFSFNPGAIGYHIASGEAISIHNPQEKGWCKNALERGITVTIGPTGEPYVDAFPKPSEFFGLMLTGRYTLVEAYYLSTRHLSWRMVLFGDPLYNPWKGQALAALPDLQKYIPEFKALRALPPSPSDHLFPHPIQLAQKRRSQQDALLSQIPALLNTNP